MKKFTKYTRKVLQNKCFFRTDLALRGLGNKVFAGNAKRGCVKFLKIIDERVLHYIS